MAHLNSKATLTFAVRLVAVAVLSVACASVLGIETTKRTDRASRSYGTGYEGCKANSCAECFPAHVTSCQGPAGYGSGYEGCEEGDCSQCQDAHKGECEGDEGYDQDGYDGCRPFADCSECASPDHQCLCQGLLPGCILVGGGDAGISPQICDEPNLQGCAECLCTSCDLSTCLADASCNDVFSCVAQYPCNPALSAVDTCYSDAFCKSVIDNAGGPTSEAYAAVLNLASCAERQQDCGCSFGTQTTPGGCEAGTDCADSSIVTPQCEAPSCTGCATTGAQCLCLGNTVDECLEAVLGASCETHFQRENDACHGCSCSTCSSELLSCFDDVASGCVPLARCINIHQCVGAACDTAETCGELLDRFGGIEGNSFQMATALAQCQDTAECPCTHQPDPQTLTCGQLQCAAFVEPGPDGGAGRESLPACCFSQQGNEFCGLEMTGVLYTGCEPRGLSGSPANPCPGFQTEDDFPYNGAFLSGCCRPTSDSSAMNGGPGVCGYNDTVTGLRCLPIEKVTGMSVTPTPCTYVR